MFEKFGFMKTVEELNAAAEGFLKEGDTESIIALAQENGIDEEDAGDYTEGMTDVFATPMTAALGRLKAVRTEKIGKVKDAHHRANQIMIYEIIRGMINEPEVAAGIMASENIVMDLVNGMKGVVYTGTDEDLRKLVRACVAGKDQLKKTAEEIKTRYGE